MTKLYALDDNGTLRYHEAWVDGASVVEHWGVVGERGDSRTHDLDADADPARSLAAVLAAAHADGFRERDPEDVTYLEIQYDLASWGDPDDHDLRVRIEDFLNEELGWTGLGHLDGGSIGSGTMEACVAVVDVPIATRVITKSLADGGLPAPARILADGEPVE